MTDDYGASLTTFADQPDIGVSADSFVISADRFFIPNVPFTFVVIRAFNKLGLENNATSCPVAIANVFRPASFTGDPDIKSLRSVLHYNI